MGFAGVVSSVCLEVTVRLKYFTKRGSVYTRQIEGERELWLKEDRGGIIHSLAGGIHISIEKLQKLVSDYPSLLDRTYCFDMGVEKEFFDGAKKEAFRGNIEKEDTIIFFLYRKGDKYAIGCSSLIERIEEEH